MPEPEGSEHSERPKDVRHSDTIQPPPHLTPARLETPKMDLIIATRAETASELLFCLINMANEGDFVTIWNVLICDSSGQTQESKFIQFLYAVLEKANLIVCKIDGRRYEIDIQASKKHKTLLDSPPTMIACESTEKTTAKAPSPTTNIGLYQVLEAFKEPIRDMIDPANKISAKLRRLDENVD